MLVNQGSAKDHKGIKIEKLTTHSPGGSTQHDSRGHAGTPRQSVNRESPAEPGAHDFIRVYWWSALGLPKQRPDL